MEYCVKEKRVGKDQPEKWKKKDRSLMTPASIKYSYPLDRFVCDL
jgi:hypothetical protein